MAVVLDQVGSRVLERSLPHLSPHGLLRRAAQHGAYHHRVVLGYASTVTAPGHAAVHSGAAPADSGIVANSVWHRQQRRFVRPEDDGQHPVFGLPGEFAGPSKLLAPTVADVLKQHTGGRAKVVSLSMKARAAVLSGGQHADLAAWYEGEIPGFTTSSRYLKQLPAWWLAWQQQHPARAHFTDWQVGDAAAMQRLLGPDDMPGEGDGVLWTSTFPHRWAASAQAPEAFLVTPQSSEYLIDFALACARQYQLGEDEVPDLLAISVSSTDYAGHAFGPDSWEYLDNLQRVDAALGRLHDALEARSPTAWIVTSDHGAATLPEALTRAGQKAGRIAERPLMQAIDAALAAAVGPQARVEAYGQPLVYLSDAARMPAVRQRSLQVAAQALRAFEGIDELVSVDLALGWRNDPNDLRRAIGRSVHARAEADLYLLPSPNYLIGVSFGTTHGSPWSYDREVPVLMWGAGVGLSQSMQPWEQSRVATSMARLLGVPAPRFAHAEALPGI